jgi:hypothetical protein
MGKGRKNLKNLKNLKKKEKLERLERFERFEKTERFEKKLAEEKKKKWWRQIRNFTRAVVACQSCHCLSLPVIVCHLLRRRR